MDIASMLKELADRQAAMRAIHEALNQQLNPLSPPPPPKPPVNSQ